MHNHPRRPATAIPSDPYSQCRVRERWSSRRRSVVLFRSWCLPRTPPGHGHPAGAEPQNLSSRAWASSSIAGDRRHRTVQRRGDSGWSMGGCGGSAGAVMPAHTAGGWCSSRGPRRSLQAACPRRSASTAAGAGLRLGQLGTFGDGLFAHLAGSVFRRVSSLDFVGRGSPGSLASITSACFVPSGMVAIGMQRSPRSTAERVADG